MRVTESRKVVRDVWASGIRVKLRDVGGLGRRGHVGVSGCWVDGVWVCAGWGVVAGRRVGMRLRLAGCMKEEVESCIGMRVARVDETSRGEAVAREARWE